MNPNNPQPSEAPETWVSSEGLHSSRRIRIQAAVLLILTLAAFVGAVLFVLKARGYFEDAQTLILVADDSEGVSVGMDVTFSGFPIGRVQRIELSPEGKAHLVVSVPAKDATWLRTSSVFTLERSIVGATKLRAFTGILTDPPLADGAKRDVLRGDAAEEIPKLAASVRDILRNINAITAGDSALNSSLANLQTATAKFNGPQGALGAVLGSEAEVKKIYAALDRANAILSKIDALGGKAGTLADKANAMADKADVRVFGKSPDAGDGGVVQDTQATIRQLNGLLADARKSLAQADAVIKEVQGAAANTREATQDLGALRADVDASVRRLDGMVNEINRKWPFKREAEVKLP
jgi:phospholipid/cholesterol/gamma-HCH transport system substrate-binding protein